MDRGAEAQAQAACRQAPRALQLAECRHELQRIALRRVDDAAVQQGQHAGVQRAAVGAGGFGRREALFVEAVFQLHDARCCGGVVGAVGARRTRRGEDAERSLCNGALLNGLEGLPVLGVLRIALLRHRIAEVGDPGQAAATLQFGADEVCRGDGVGGPDRRRAMAPDQLHAPAHGVKAPADPTVGPRHGGHVALADGEVPCRVQSESSFDDGAGRDVGHQIGAGAFVGAQIGRQHHGLPVEARQLLDKTQGALDAAAAGQRREVVGDHQHGLHAGAAPGCLKTVLRPMPPMPPLRVLPRGSRARSICRRP